jgi:hypothetical protein
MQRTLSFERIYPILFAASSAIAAWLLDFSLPTEATKELLAATISFGAILAGFIGTAKSILMALPESLLGKLRTSTYLDDLAEYLSTALTGSLITSTLSVVGFFTLSESIKGYYPALWLGSLIFAGISFWRASRIMVLLLKIDPGKL